MYVFEKALRGMKKKGESIYIYIYISMRFLLFFNGQERERSGVVFIGIMSWRQLGMTNLYIVCCCVVLNWYDGSCYLFVGIQLISKMIYCPFFFF